MKTLTSDQFVSHCVLPLPHLTLRQLQDFGTIIEQLNDAMIVCSLDGDEEAQTMWRKYAKGQESMHFTAFAKALYLSLGIGSPDQSSTPYQCLQLLLASKDKRDSEETVTLDKFGLFLKWFGPLAAKSSVGNIIDRVYNTCKEESVLMYHSVKIAPNLSCRWFHGAIQREESEQKLATEKKGTFLVRLSTTEPDKTPFTISKVWIDFGFEGYLTLLHSKNRSTRRAKSTTNEYTPMDPTRDTMFLLSTQIRRRRLKALLCPTSSRSQLRNCTWKGIAVEASSLCCSRRTTRSKVIYKMTTNRLYWVFKLNCCIFNSF